MAPRDDGELRQNDNSQVVNEGRQRRRDRVEADGAEQIPQPENGRNDDRVPDPPPLSFHSASLVETIVRERLRLEQQLLNVANPEEAAQLQDEIANLDEATKLGRDLTAMLRNRKKRRPADKSLDTKEDDDKRKKGPDDDDDDKDQGRGSGGIGGAGVFANASQIPAN